MTKAQEAIRVIKIFNATINQIDKESKEDIEYFQYMLCKLEKDLEGIENEVANFLYAFTEFKDTDLEETRIEYSQELAKTIIETNK